MSGVEASCHVLPSDAPHIEINFGQLKLLQLIIVMVSPSAYVHC
jgi:hypothetical protein